MELPLQVLFVVVCVAFIASGVCGSSFNAYGLDANYARDAVQRSGLSATGYRANAPHEVVYSNDSAPFCDVNDIVNCTVRVTQDVCSGMECVSCPELPDKWRTDANQYHFSILHVAGGCNHTGGVGNVQWTSPTPILSGVTVIGNGIAPSIDNNGIEPHTDVSLVSGPCPLIRLGSGGQVKDLKINCTNQNARGGISVEGTDVEINNVFVEGAPVFTASRLVTAIDVSGFVATNIESSGRTAGSFANVLTTGGKDVRVTCHPGEYLVIQPLHGFKLKRSEHCVLIDVGTLLGYYGNQYEMEFYNAYGGADGLDGFYTYIIGIEIAVLFAGGLFLLIEHQDIWYLRTVKADISKMSALYEGVEIRDTVVKQQMNDIETKDKISGMQGTTLSGF